MQGFKYRRVVINVRFLCDGAHQKLKDAYVLSYDVKKVRDDR